MNTFIKTTVCISALGLLTACGALAAVRARAYLVLSAIT